MRSYQALQAKRLFIRGKYIVGIDPAKAKHQAVVIDPDGIQLGKSFTFKTDHSGYTEMLWKKIGKVLEKINPEDVVFAIERSCNLWLTLSDYLVREGYKVLLISPVVTRRSRPFINQDFSRTDPKDALLVASSARDGYFNYYRKYSPEIEAMHRLSIAYDKLRKNCIQQQHRIRSLVEAVFPEFFEVLNLDTRSGLYILERYLTPQDFIEMDITKEARALEILSNRAHGQESLEKLQMLAQQSIGCQRQDEEIMADRLMLNSWLSLLIPIQQAMDKIINELITLAKQNPCFEILCSLKGVSKKMAALFIAEVRDPYLFDHYKKVEKMAGVNLRLSQSGNSSGPRHISHMGNNRLRWVLFKMTEETAKYLPEVRIKFLKRQLKKRCYKKNLMAATPQMLKLIMALIKKNRPYEYRKESLEEMKRLEEKYEQLKKQTQRKKRQAA